MKKTVLLTVFSVLALAPVASFGATLTGCTPGTPVSDLGGGFLATGSCDFYHEPAAYPFDLTNFLSDNNTISLAENYQIPAYIVFTTDPLEVTNQMWDSIGDASQSAWQDVLFFVPNVVPVPLDPTQDLSTQAQLYWGAGLPSPTTVDSFLGGGYAVYQTADGGGNYSWIVGDDPNGGPLRLNFNVHDSSTVPEPSTLLMMAAAGLTLLTVRRRRA